MGETGPTIDSIEVAEFESHDVPQGMAQQESPGVYAEYCDLMDQSQFTEHNRGGNN